jgi:hypothetical protein
MPDAFKDFSIQLLIVMLGVIVTLISTLFRMWTKNNQTKVEEIGSRVTVNEDDIQDLKQIVAQQKVINEAQITTNSRLEEITMEIVHHGNRPSKDWR